MSKKKIYILIGTRPNFIKITQFKRLSDKYNFDIKVIHTGQHFDSNMADIFFQQLGIQPDYFLNVGGLSPNKQVGSIIIKLEELFQKEGTPDFLIVPGDVNSTLAGAIAANKLGVKLIHLESGLRSFDKKMPEEHNRIVADNLSDLCMVTEPSGLKNLANEGIQADIYHVGNTMIDTLVYFEDKIDQSNITQNLGIENESYILCTFHRPSNVDTSNQLNKLVELMSKLGEIQTTVLPLHPRTKKMLEANNLLSSLEEMQGLILTEPQGYFEFQKLIKGSSMVITDSGGIQEETTFRQVPCLTMRENTERPVTIDEGTNTLVKFDADEISKLASSIIKGEYKNGSIPEYWDGLSTERILDVLSQY